MSAPRIARPDAEREGELPHVFCARDDAGPLKNAFGSFPCGEDTKAPKLPEYVQFSERGAVFCRFARLCG